MKIYYENYAQGQDNPEPTSVVTSDPFMSALFMTLLESSLQNMYLCL